MTSLIAFVKNHPVIGGVAFAVFGVFLVFVSIDGAKRFRLYENAREITGQVLSITEASRVPPRFDLTVSWSDGSSAERSLIRTGPKAVDAPVLGRRGRRLRWQPITPPIHRSF